MCTFIAASCPRQYSPWLKDKWRVKTLWELPKTTGECWKGGNTRVAESIWIAWQIRECGGGECYPHGLQDSSHPDLQGGDLNDLLTALLICHHSDGKHVADLATMWLILQPGINGAVDHPSPVSSSSSSFLGPLPFPLCQSMRGQIAPSSEVMSLLHGSLGEWSESTTLDCRWNYLLGSEQESEGCGIAPTHQRGKDQLCSSQCLPSALSTPASSPLLAPDCTSSTCSYACSRVAINTCQHPSVSSVGNLLKSLLCTTPCSDCNDFISFC